MPTAVEGKRKRKTGPITKLRNFFRDVRAEMRKVIWPSAEEVGKYTAIVLFLIFVLGLFITLVDQIVAFITKGVLGW